MELVNVNESCIIHHKSSPCCTSLSEPCVFAAMLCLFALLQRSSVIISFKYVGFTKCDTL